jgi:hypothetical protein
MLDKIYVALIHYPVYTKFGDIKTTAITNLDVHDIGRTCRTYNIKKYFVVNNLLSQRSIVNAVLNYWKVGKGGYLNPSRKEALKYVFLKKYYEDVLEDIKDSEGTYPIVATTSAKKWDKKRNYSYKEMAKYVETESKPILILFGTGYGLAEEIIESSHILIEPIRGFGDYNHLSVRAAAAISLDRIIGEKVMKGGNYASHN